MFILLWSVYFKLNYYLCALYMVYAVIEIEKINGPPDKRTTI
jgi:hypothetical protein